MKVAYLTAGAGGMYCGSCLRDNTLAAALIRQGRDVVLIPIYSPIRTDEPDVSTPAVYYGGINVYLQHRSALFRLLPRAFDRILDAPGLLRRALRNAGSAPPELAGPLTLSILRGEAGAQRKELHRLLDALDRLRPDVVHLPDAFFVGLAGPIQRRLRAAVVCTLTGEDILLDRFAPADRDAAIDLIRRGGAEVDAFITVSRYYGRAAAGRFGLPEGRIHHVPLGVRMDYEAGSEKMSLAPGSDDFTIGYLARICPEKGLHILTEAFARLRGEGRDCRLKVAGTLGRSDRPWFDSLRRDLSARGLDSAVEYDGELDREGKLRFLRSVDLFSVPAVYREAKGLYVLEAMAQGVPVVQPAHGSFPELIEATGGGLLVRPSDPDDLAAGLSRLMDDPALRRRMGDQAHRAVVQGFTDEVMAREVWKVFELAAASPRA